MKSWFLCETLFIIEKTNTMSIFSFFFLTFILFHAIPCDSNEPGNPEVEALMSIKRNLRDRHGVLNNWDENSVDPCSWTMITCSPDNLVTGLGAPSQSLSGTLSATIGNLKNLRQVLLQNNNITGQLPPELGSLSKLQTLDLSNNKLAGVVPESLGQLNSLQYLRLNNNSLSGAFPVSLAQAQLAFLDLSYNNLSGPVPRFLARTFSVAGNPLICGKNKTEGCSGSTTPGVLSSNPSSSSDMSKKLVIALGISLSIAFFILLALGFAWHRKKQRKEFITNISENNERFGNLRNFTFRELQSATGNFSSKNLLGAGGFGDVYKGGLGDGTMVAVKRLKDVIGTAGESQFQMELEIISLAVHRNLLRLIGYCVTSTERLLVYPFMSNGSVASRLKGKPALDWNTRKRIAIGTARGLLYLHEQCDPKIIHRDIKAANVLLDDYYEAVVGDFGLAKLLDHADSHVITVVRGTVGHIAPEYLSTGQSSEKTDVFGFGILLIELISGMRTREFGKTAYQKCAMLDWVKKVHQEKKVEMLVDRELRNDYDRIEVGELLQVALLCTHNLPISRPKMSEVVQMLEGDGLAEKWAASHSHIIGASKTFVPFDKANNGSAYPPSVTMQGDIGPDNSTIFGIATNEEDDEYTLDSYAIELSGPR